MVDSVVTVITWIPWRMIFKDSCANTQSQAEKIHLNPCRRAVHLATTFIWMSNCYTTPIVYFSLNKKFGVSQSVD